MEFVGDSDILGLGALRLDKNPAIPMPYQDQRLWLRGRLAGARSRKVVLVATDEAVAILGGVTWYDTLKPEPHPLDIEFHASSIRSIEVGFQAPELIEAEMHLKPLRLNLVKQPVPSITFTVQSSATQWTRKSLTFVPEQEFLIRPAARVLADLVNDDHRFYVAAASVFPDMGGQEYSFEAIYDCRLLDDSMAAWIPSRLIQGCDDIAILRNNHLSTDNQMLLQSAARRLEQLTGCLVCFPAKYGHLAPLLKDLTAIQVEVTDHLEEVAIRLGFKDGAIWIAPGKRTDQPETSLGNFWPLLVAFNHELSA